MRVFGADPMHKKDIAALKSLNRLETIWWFYTLTFALTIALSLISGIVVSFELSSILQVFLTICGLLIFNLVFLKVSATKKIKLVTKMLKKWEIYPQAVMHLDCLQVTRMIKLYMKTYWPGLDEKKILKAADSLKIGSMFLINRHQVDAMSLTALESGNLNIKHFDFYLQKAEPLVLKTLSSNPYFPLDYLLSLPTSSTSEKGTDRILEKYPNEVKEVFLSFLPNDERTNKELLFLAANV